MKQKLGYCQTKLKTIVKLFMDTRTGVGLKLNATIQYLSGLQSKVNYLTNFKAGLSQYSPGDFSCKLG